jgi:hypothetical protein
MYEMDQCGHDSLLKNLSPALRLGEEYKKGSRKDAKSQRKEGIRKVTSFVLINNILKIPFILSKMLFQYNYSTRPIESINYTHPLENATCRDVWTKFH